MLSAVLRNATKMCFVTRAYLLRPTIDWWPVLQLALLGLKIGNAPCILPGAGQAMKEVINETQELLDLGYTEGLI